MYSFFKKIFTDSLVSVLAFMSFLAGVVLVVVGVWFEFGSTYGLITAGGLAMSTGILLEV